MSEVNNIKFPSLLKQIRESRKLSMRSMAKLLGCTPTYISDLESGKRRLSSKVVDVLNDKLILSENEGALLVAAYVHDRLAVPVSLVKYLIDNDLLDSLYALKELDEDGANIKQLVKDLQNRKVKR